MPLLACRSRDVESYAGLGTPRQTGCSTLERGHLHLVQRVLVYGPTLLTLAR
jgi:hypothetical protein